MRLLIFMAALSAANACDFAALEMQDRRADDSIATGRLPDARLALHSLTELARSCGDSAVEVNIRAMIALAGVERMTGHAKDSLAWARRAADLSENSATPNAPLHADALLALAQAQAASGKFYEAEPVIQQAIEIWQREGGNHRAELATCINTLAVLYLGLADPDGARRQLRKALEYGRNSGADLVVATSLHSLATAAWQQGDGEQSLRYLDEAFTLAEHVLGHNHPYLADILASYSRVLASLHRKDEARQYRDRARALTALMAH